MTPTYRTVIQALPMRAERAEILREQTGGAIMYQPPYKTCDNHYIKVLESLHEEDYLVRLEDDASLAPDYQDVLPLCLEAMREHQYSVLMLFCTDMETVYHLPDIGHKIISLDPLCCMSGVGLIYDRRILPDFVQFYKSSPWPGPVHQYGPQDVSVALFLQKHNLKLAAVTPSIIQHEGLDSYLGHAHRGARRSLTFTERYGD
jgi:hypothetical protein